MKIESQDDFNKSLTKALKCSKKQYDKMSAAGINHVKENYNFEDYENNWVELIDTCIEENGSWETRKIINVGT